MRESLDECSSIVVMTAERLDLLVLYEGFPLTLVGLIIHLHVSNMALED